MNINEDWNRKFLLKANNLCPKPKTKNTNPFGKNYFVNTKINNSEILIYQNSEGNIKIDIRLEKEAVS